MYLPTPYFDSYILSYTPPFETRFLTVRKLSESFLTVKSASQTEVYSVRYGGQTVTLFCGVFLLWCVF